MKRAAEPRTKVVIVTRRGKGKELFEEEYYIEETAPFKDVVDAHHEMRKAEPNTFAYRMIINGDVVKIDSSDNYMATTRALRIGDNARLIAYKQKREETNPAPSPPQKKSTNQSHRASSSSETHRRQRRSGGARAQNKTSKTNRRGK